MDINYILHQSIYKIERNNTEQNHTNNSLPFIRLNTHHLPLRKAIQHIKKNHLKLH